MTSTNTTYRITDDNPIAITADWLLLLLRHGKPELLDQPFDKHNSYRDLAARIAALRPGPKTPTIANMLACGIMPEELLDIGRLARRFELAGFVEDHCPDFPWFQDSPFPYPSTIEAFDLPWRLREALRLTTGVYTALPWATELDPIPDHFAHLSLDGQSLAYTDTPEKGEKDIQTVMKPARYLKRFYPELADHTARDIAERIEKPAVLRFAVTADDIHDIYRRGPSSCMSRAERDYEGHCHPVRVYGDSDLQLAYITGSDDEPSARCLVWPETKRHGRIYGHESRMRRTLEREGWTPGKFDGARIRRIDDEHDDRRVIMPYLDGVQRFDLIDDDWIRIDEDGEHLATGTAGIVRIAGFVICPQCDDSVSEDDLYDVGNTEWCESCRDSHAFCSGFSSEYFPDGESTDVIVSRNQRGAPVEETWAECEAEAHAFYCDGSGRYYDARGFTSVTLLNGETWEEEYFEEHGDPGDLPETPATVVTAQPVAPAAAEAGAP